MSRRTPLVSSPIPRFRIAVAAAALLAPGCGGGGGGGGGGTPATAPSTLTVALADAPSDQVTSFVVDVTALSVKQTGGVANSLIANTITVDLATLDRLSDVLAIQSVPGGSYTSATVTLDFTGAACWLVGQSTPATLQDDDGNPLTGPVTLTLDLTSAPIQATGGGHHEVEFDFDLNHSLAIVGNTVRVVPSIRVRVDRSDTHDLVATGTLVGADANAKTATVDLKTLFGDPLATVTLAFDTATIFHIDGIPSVGNQGIGVLAAKAPGTWLEAYGTKDPATAELAVYYIEVGHGTWNGGQDLVEGYVIDRSDAVAGTPSLTVLGFGSDHAHTTLQYNTTFTVTASFANTTVLRRDDSFPFTTDTLNIGQLVHVFGTLSGTDMDATAGSALVRELPTAIAGTANAIPTGEILSMNTIRVGPLDAVGGNSPFVWADGGSSPPDPSILVVDIGTFGSSLNIVPGSALIPLGYFSAITDSVEDVTTVGLLDITADALLTLRDRAGGFTVTTDASAAHVRFTINGSSGADEKATIELGLDGEQPLPTAPAPTVVAGAAPTFYELHHGTTGAVQAYSLYSSFVTALGAALGGGEQLQDFVASGTYNAGTNVVSASYATAVVK